MRFQVPQFIETETKVVGPFTLKQFLFVAGGISMVVVEYMLLPGLFFVVLALLTAGFFAALAFLKVNDQPFLNYFAYFLAYIFGAKRYQFTPKQTVPEQFPKP
ncbi:MAG TPA: PrgI family protein [Candidatus Paceibacterota bacterium]|nr:PrgI family protein [Candidatus Paceibacterota bacterium]